MLMHPHIVVPKIILFMILAVTLLLLYGWLPPEQFAVAVVVAIVVFVITSVLVWVIFLKKLSNPDSKLARDMILMTDMRSEDGFKASSDDLAHLAGKRGVAQSLLRPSGTALIDGVRVSVITDGTFIAAGERVEVVSVKGSRVLVRAVEDEQ